MIASFIALPEVSYATLERGNRVVEKISITNNGEDTFYDLVVEMSAEPVFAHPWTYTIPALEPGETWKSEEVELELDAHFLCSLQEAIPGQLSLEVKADGNILTTDCFFVDVMPPLLDDEDRSGDLLLGIVDGKEVTKQVVWERKLLDLSLRNNLLNMRLTKGAFQLVAVGLNSLEDGLSDGLSYTILPRPAGFELKKGEQELYEGIEADEGLSDYLRKEQSKQRLRCFLTEEELRQSLTKLYRTSRLSLEENGANTLYLATGLLRWKDNKGNVRPHYAPILLLPVELIRTPISSGNSFLLRSRDEEVMLNITLVEMLRQIYDIDISGLNPLPKDASGVDTALVFETLRKAIANQPEWEVEDKAVLGIFSFSKFIMWNDIHNNTQYLSQNPIVSSLIDGTVKLEADDERETDGDPEEQFSHNGMLLPIGADSSQMSAIDETLRGKSFVLHGPPGTGKSQTITNIIANALYAGKRVLFVAEKMAALQVVQHRLESIGLGPFCLEIHSNKAKKSSVLSQLQQSIESTPVLPSDDFSHQQKQLLKERKELGDFVETMHRNYPADLSLYDCIARWASFSDDLPEFPIEAQDLETLSPASIAATEKAVMDFQNMAVATLREEGYPLLGVYLDEFAPSAPTEAHKAIAALQEVLAPFAESAQNLLSVFQLTFQRPLSFADYEALAPLCDAVLHYDVLLPNMLTYEGSTADFFDTLLHHVGKGRVKDAQKAQILQTWQPAIFEANPQAWLDRWQASEQQWILSRLSQRKTILKELQAFLRPGVTLSKTAVPEALQTLIDFHSAQEEVFHLGETYRPLLETVWDSGEGSWDLIQQSTQTASNLLAAIGKLSLDEYESRSLRVSLESALQDDIPLFRKKYRAELDTFLHQLSNLTVLTEGVETSLLADLKGMKGGDWCSMVAEKTAVWDQNLQDLHDWTVYNLYKATLLKREARPLVEKVEQCQLVPNLSLDCYRKSLYHSYADYIASKEPVLRKFHKTSFEEKIRQFKVQCHQFESLTRQQIVARLFAQRPNFEKEAGSNSEINFLQKNIRNGGRGISIRRLIDQLPTLLPRLCPCMLMSPISVAQYIDVEKTPFDLVIFDEASQMPTSEAVGAIARGKQLIVVGDPKQMPPTDFFSISSFDEDHADLEDLESILDDCLALSIPSRHLKWHYRSKHESLIAFSNLKYYDSKLLTFPSPDDLDTKVSFHHVEGIYDRGSSRQNKAEAQAVIAEIEQRLSDPVLVQKSIGVVTFNTNQQSIIEDKLNELLNRRPELEELALGGKEPIFVKNLENVQGDERDIILFSIGFGPDKEGKITLNFGPLNREGGWRRLNVAVSRARYEMMIFSTLRADDIDTSRTHAEGVVGLKAFLDFAEKGRNSLLYTASQKNTSSSDGFAEHLASRLRERGYEVRTNIGCSDFKVDLGIVDPQNPSRYLLGIVCDGYNYCNAKSTRDRLITQPSIMSLLGWKICHVWALDWWENPDRCLENIQKAIGS